MIGGLALQVGAAMSPDGEALLQARTHNIGVAMATGGGLVVPNIKQVEAKSIVTIAQELAQLQVLAAAGKLEVNHVTGGTVTISNIGGAGSGLGSGHNIMGPKELHAV